MAERRRAPRQTITGKVILKNDEHQLSGELINASEAGVGIYAAAAAQPGSIWTLQLSLENRLGKEVGAVDLQVILVRQIHTGEGIYWGLAITGQTWEQRQRWERLLAYRLTQK